MATYAQKHEALEDLEVLRDTAERIRRLRSEIDQARVERDAAIRRLNAYSYASRRLVAAHAGLTSARVQQIIDRGPELRRLVAGGGATLGPPNDRESSPGNSRASASEIRD
jgi:hypothetical protein